MGTSTLLRRPSRKARRQGSALLLTALALIPLFAMVAFAIDYGRICVAKAELQRAADSAALAGAQELYRLQRPGSTVSPEDAVKEARKAAMEYAQLNSSSGAQLALLESDIEVGYLSNASVPGTELDTSDPAMANTVRVAARRDGSSNGLVPMTFARIFGKESAGAEARATASFINRIAGFKAPPVSTEPTIPIMPLALDAETWLAAVNGQTSDVWAWDAEQQKVVPGSDGIAECSLYPVEVKESNTRGKKPASPKVHLPAEDRGAVNIGSASYDKGHLIQQILFGISQADWEFHNGALTFDENGELFLGGKRGLEPLLGLPLAGVRGETRIIPIFSKVEGQGSNTEYTIVEWGGVRILDVDLNGANKRVIVQPAEVVTGGTVTGDRARSLYIYSRIWLAR